MVLKIIILVHLINKGQRALEVIVKNLNVEVKKVDFNINYIFNEFYKIRNLICRIQLRFKYSTLF